MKIQIILCCILIAFAGGCSTPGTNNEEDKEEKNEFNVEEKQHAGKKTESEVYVPNPQVTDDRSLKTVDQEISDEKGEAKLLAYNQLEKKLEIGPIEMTIKEAKILEFRPDYSLIDFFHGYTHEEKFPLLKVFVEIRNTSDLDLNFAPIAVLQTSNGEKLTWEEDVYLEEMNGKIGPGEIKKGNIGFILENPDFDSFTLTTSKVLDGKQEVNKEKILEADI